MDQKPRRFAWVSSLIAVVAAGCLSTNGGPDAANAGKTETAACNIVVGNRIEYRTVGPAITGSSFTGPHTISVARGESESVVATILRGEPGSASPELTLSDAGPFAVNVFRVLPVNTAADGEVFDVLVPTGTTVAGAELEGKRAIFLLDIEIPWQTEPGSYHVRLGAQNCTATVAVQVHDVLMPASSPATIQATIDPDKRTVQPDADPSRPAKRQPHTSTRLAREAMTYGVNSFAGVFPRISPNSSRTEVGQEMLAELEDFVKDPAVMHFRLPVSQHHRSKTFFGGSINKSDADRFQLLLQEELLPYANLLNNAATREKLVIKLWDEPVPANYPEIQRLHAIARELLPDIPLELTEQPDAGLLGSTDIWTIYIDYLLEDDVDNQHELGNRVFLYANQIHAVQNSSDSMRQIGWLLWRYDLDGYHFWRLNWWNKDPWTTHSSWGNDFDKSGTFFYPGPNGAVYPSIRMMAFREGLEDWRLLQKLEQCTGNTAARSWLEDTQPLIMADANMPISGNVYAMRAELLALLESCNS